MEKKRGKLLVGLVFLVLIVGNIYTYLGESRQGVSGFSVKNFPEKVTNFNFSTIVFFGQWVLVIVAVLLFLRHYRKKDGEDENVNIKIERKKGETETDLDSFYNLMKRENELKVSVIAKAFGVSKDQALEWGKILENQNLVSVEYPAFSEPEIKLNNNGKKEEEEKGKKEE